MVLAWMACQSHSLSVCVDLECRWRGKKGLKEEDVTALELTCNL